MGMAVIYNTAPGTEAVRLMETTGRSGAVGDPIQIKSRRARAQWILGCQWPVAVDVLIRPVSDLIPKVLKSGVNGRKLCRRRSRFWKKRR